MTVRYRIVGTIQIDPLPGGVSSAHETTLENPLLALTVTDALAGASGKRRHCWQKCARTTEEKTIVPADLAALLAELQGEWDELEIG